MPYAEVEELGRWMLHPGFDADETARAADMLAAGGAVIDNFLGLGVDRLAQSVDTIDVDGSGTCLLLLPRWPVSSVTEVTETDADGLATTLTEGEGNDFTWKTEGILTRLGDVWIAGDRNIHVVYTPGYVTVSADVKRINLRLAAAGWHNPAGALTEQFDDHRVRWAVPGMELTTGEKHMLARYKDR